MSSTSSRNSSPDDISADSRWRVDLDTYLSSVKGVAVAKIDLLQPPQLDPVSHQLQLVHRDLLQVVRQLAKKPYIDSNRVALWGEGYGGWLVGHILADDKEEVVKCGVAASPITQWRLYNSFVAERYLGSPEPEENYAQYHKADLTVRSILDWKILLKN